MSGYGFCIKCYCDLDLWPSDLKIYKGYLLTMTNLPTMLMTVTQKLFKILSGHDVANGRTDGQTDRRTDVITDGHLLGNLVPNKCPSVCPDWQTDGRTDGQGDDYMLPRNFSGSITTATTTTTTAFAGDAAAAGAAAAAVAPITHRQQQSIAHRQINQKQPWHK